MGPQVSEWMTSRASVVESSAAWKGARVILPSTQGTQVAWRTLSRSAFYRRMTSTTFDV